MLGETPESGRPFLLLPADRTTITTKSSQEKLPHVAPLSHPVPRLLPYPLFDTNDTNYTTNTRYGEYVIQLDDRSGRSSDGASETKAGFAQGPCAAHEEDGGGNRGEGRGEACRESLKKLDELWDELVSALGFVIPLLNEVGPLY